MGELKSAWEIAQERARRLGRLSAEEEAEQEVQRYRQIGQALAQRWLDGAQESDIAAELENHEEQKRDIIKQAMVERLAEAIDLRSAQGTDRIRRVIGAISALKPAAKPKAEEITLLLQEYEEAQDRIRERLEESARQKLHQLRISGTAIGGINLQANPEWQRAHQDLVQSLAPRLNNLKEALVK